MGRRSVLYLRRLPYSSPSSQTRSSSQNTLLAYDSRLPHRHRYLCSHHGLTRHDLHDRGCGSPPHRKHVVCPDEQLPHGKASPVRYNTDEWLLCSLCEAGKLLPAVELLSHIKRPINSKIYVFLLKVCIACEASALARQVYTHLIQYSSGVTPLLADYVAITFAKCGVIDDASAVFNALSRRTALSWTAMIAAFTDCGCWEDALQMFQFMHEDGVEPDSYTFVSLFKACGICKNLKQGMRLHLIAHERGFTSNVFVGNTLLSMYTKCGHSLKADEIFRSLPRQSIASWNGMLSALMEDGLAEDVLLSYRQICEELNNPDPISLVLALQACGSLAQVSVEKGEFNSHSFVEIGQALHSFARRRFYELDLFVGTALINMYGKCGLVEHALHVFEALPLRDVVCCNAMMSAFILKTQEERALRLYTLMEMEGLSPDQSTFVLLFQACGSFVDREDAFAVEEAEFLDIGRALHLDACKQGLGDILAVANSIIMMYGKQGAVMEAEYLFSSIREHNVISWSNMLSVYVDQGKGEKGLLLYRQMQEEGVMLDPHVLALVLQACTVLPQEPVALIKRKDSNKGLPYEMGRAIVVDAHRCGFSLDFYIGNVLINMYSKCVGVVEAEEAFLSLPERDIVAWTTMLSAYLEHDQARKALQLYVVMHEDCVAPNELTFVIALRACSIVVECEKASLRIETSWKLMMLDMVQALHSDANRMGCMTDSSIWGALLTAYGKCGDIAGAENLSATISHNCIAVRKAMLFIYLEHGLGRESLCLYKEMQKQHAVVDEVILMCLVHACRVSANLETCRELHFGVVASGYGKSIFLATSLIHTYASCASIEDMETAFEEVVGPDTVCWTACITGNAGLGNFIRSAQILERLRLAGIEPDGMTLTALLLSCTNSGHITEGLEYSSALREDHGVILHLRHHGLMVGLLGRAGNLKRVEAILSSMSMQTDSAIWSSLLGLCHIHGNMELAKKAFTQALLKEQIEASMFVLMSNICHSSGQERDSVEPEYSTIQLQ